MNRLELLHNAHIINDQEYQVLKKIETQLSQWNEAKKWKFLTHAAMALSRLSKQEDVDPINSLILKEIKNNQYYSKATWLIDRWFANLNYEISLTEKNYLLMHVLDFIEETKWK